MGPSKMLLLQGHNIKSTLLNDNLKWAPSTFPLRHSLQFTTGVVRNEGISYSVTSTSSLRDYGGCVIIPTIPE